MKTRKLNIDDFRENQLSVTEQKSINGGGTPPSGGIPTPPIGNI